MQNHASLPPPLFGKCASGNAADLEKADSKQAGSGKTDTKRADPEQGDFRFMFSSDETMKRFVGYGKGKEEKTRLMLERLAVRITKEGEETPGENNDKIPAGYTYFAQMVGHDIVHSVPGGIDMTEAQPLTRNLRSARLILDTIYGRGPVASPLAYEVSKKGGQQRARLRLGKCRMDGAKPAGGRALDIPRTQCPYIDNLPDRGATEALLADPRNDVSLISSQMTVLFHLLHNLVEEKFAIEDEKSGKPEKGQAAERFARTRRVTAFVFRDIIKKDLMPKLLSPESHDRLGKALSSGEFLDDIDDDRIPFEFSHAAYRIGHAMVRSSYAVNANHTFTGVKDIVRFTSSRRPHEMPLSSDWLVQWSRFFKLNGEAPNPSQTIRPAVAPALGVNDLFATQDDDYGGLVLRDLLRGADAGQCSVKSLIGKLPEKEKKHRFIVDAGYRAKQIEKWLRKRSSKADKDRGLTDEDIEIISNDPPLIFFILMEAQEVAEGVHLGPVGSMVVGETVYAALYRTQSAIEKHPETMKAVEAVFGPTPPTSMPELIQHLESNDDLRSS